MKSSCKAVVLVGDWVVVIGEETKCVVLISFVFMTADVVFCATVSICDKLVFALMVSDLLTF